jgi:allophanate hydrolase subunit 1
LKKTTTHFGPFLGGPSSGLIAELFLQHTENTHLAALSHKHKIIEYIRYVDDVLVIYDSTHTNIHNILADFNAIHSNLQFTAETEVDNTINYLDISIHRSPNST